MTKKIAMAMKNRIFAMPLVPAATFVKPKNPAMTDTIKNMAAHFRMNYSFPTRPLNDAAFDCRQDEAVGGSTETLKHARSYSYTRFSGANQEGGDLLALQSGLAFCHANRRAHDSINARHGCRSAATNTARGRRTDSGRICQRTGRRSIDGVSPQGFGSRWRQHHIDVERRRPADLCTGIHSVSGSSERLILPTRDRLPRLPNR